MQSLKIGGGGFTKPTGTSYNFDKVRSGAPGGLIKKSSSGMLRGRPFDSEGGGGGGAGTFGRVRLFIFITDSAGKFYFRVNRGQGGGLACNIAYLVAGMF